MQPLLQVLCIGLIVAGSVWGFTSLSEFGVPEVPVFSDNPADLFGGLPIDNIAMQLSELDDKHFSIHVWGKDSAEVDMKIARRIKDAEIEIGTDSSTLGMAIGLQAIPYVGQVLSTAACRWDSIEDIKATLIRGLSPDAIADNITDMWMNLEDAEETIPDEEYRTLFLVSYGGPAVNQHAREYAMDKNLPLYFDRDEKGWKIVDRYTGKEYRGGEYGLVLAIPRVKSIGLEELYNNLEYDGEILLYRVIIAGNTRTGTRAAGEWYAKTLEASNLVLERISDFVCGNVNQDELAAGLATGSLDYLIDSISLDDLGEMQQAVEGYVKVMLLTSLDRKTELKDVKLPGYVALIKADEKGGKLVKIYPVI